jgi:hypothetical protein
VTRYIATFPALPLTYQCTVVWEARDPNDDTLVDGVVIQNPVLYGLNLTPGAAPSKLDIGPYQLIPGPSA